ncbi:MAG: hypothetical protein AAFS10_11715 [Myxococcota bacterium]
MQPLIDFLDSYALVGPNEEALRLRLLRLFEQSPHPADRTWLVRLLLGRHRFRRHVQLKTLRIWTLEHTQTPEWLYALSHASVRDHAETCALLIPNEEPSTDPLHIWLGQHLTQLNTLSDDALKTAITDAWDRMDHRQRFLWNRWITSTFRLNIPEPLLFAVLSQLTQHPTTTIAQRVAKPWSEPDHHDAETAWQTLIDDDTSDTAQGHPHPFATATALPDTPQQLDTEPTAWLAEWQWRGERAQLIRRGNTTLVWTRSGQLVTERLPEVASMGEALPDGTVLDGQLLVWRDGPCPIDKLHERLSRARPTRRQQSDLPVVMMAYDLLELNQTDLRPLPLEERRQHLRNLLTKAHGAGRVGVSPAISAPDWDGLHQAHSRCRQRRVAGLILKRRDQPYGQGWYAWASEPLRVQAVVLYVRKPNGQPHARRATGSTLALWSHGKLVPITHASLDPLPAHELDAIHQYVKDNTTEKFGPARAIKPGIIVELEFDAVLPSKRHRIGLQLHQPRVMRWAQGAALDTIDHLKTLRDWLT